MYWCTGPAREEHGPRWRHNPRQQKGVRMSLIQLFTGLLAVLAGIVGWQMYRYPGG